MALTGILTASTQIIASGCFAAPRRTISADRTTKDTYLRTLPGWGFGSGPFEEPWDPLDLVGRASNVAEIRRWRESEITHGRVAMLAAVGFIVGEQLQDDSLFFNFDGHITGPAINQSSQVKQGFWEPLLIAIGLAESYRTSIGWATLKGTGFNCVKDEDEYSLGDLGFDPLGLKPTDEDELRLLQTEELNNGRLAMIAVVGFVLQVGELKTELGLPHQPGIIPFTFTGTPQNTGGGAPSAR